MTKGNGRLSDRVVMFSCSLPLVGVMRPGVDTGIKERPRAETDIG